MKVRAIQDRGPVLHEGTLDHFIGAVLDVEKTKATGKNHFTLLEPATEIPFTAYNRRLVADGDLAAADLETAKLCGVEFDAKKHADLDAKAKKSKEDAVKAAQKADADEKKAAKEAAKSEGSQAS